MDKYAKLKELLKSIGNGREANAPVLFQAKVMGVQDDCCTVNIGGLQLSDVRLKAIVDGNTDSSLLVVPVAGSVVLVGSLTGDYKDLTVLSIDRFDKIVLGGTANGGMVKAPDLVKRLNEIEKALTALVNDYKVHVHPVTALGSPTGPIAATSVKDAGQTDVNGIVNVKIVH